MAVLTVLANIVTLGGWEGWSLDWAEAQRGSDASIHCER
jgi:hypothetical protein